VKILSLSKKSWPSIAPLQATTITSKLNILASCRIAPEHGTLVLRVRAPNCCRDRWLRRACRERNFNAHTTASSVEVLSGRTTDRSIRGVADMVFPPQCESSAVYRASHASPLSPRSSSLRRLLWCNVGEVVERREDAIAHSSLALVKPGQGMSHGSRARRALTG